MKEPREPERWPMNTVESLAERLYGLAAKAQALPSEYDQIFKLVTKDGACFIMKVMHPSRDESFVEMQCRALQHLAKTAPEVEFSRVIPSKKGEVLTKVRSAEADEQLIWLLSYVPGKPLFETRPHSPELFEELGKILGVVDRSLKDFRHPAVTRELKWNLSVAMWIRDRIRNIEDPARRALVDHAIKLYEIDVVPQLPALRRSVIYGDANDYNVLVRWVPGKACASIGLIDLGDMHEGITVAEPAVAAAYALLGKDDPLWPAAAIVAGYNRVVPLEERELRVLFPLIVVRLAVSVVNSELAKRSGATNPYLSISEAPAWAALERLCAIPPRFAYYVLRHACALDPVPAAGRLATWLVRHRQKMASVVDVPFTKVAPHVMDLGIGGELLGADPQRSQCRIRAKVVSDELRRVDNPLGIGRYDEARFTSAAHGCIGHQSEGGGAECVHMGLDIFAAAGANVRACLDGVVHRVATVVEGGEADTTVILRHECGDSGPLFTVYRHLSSEGILSLTAGQRIDGGEVIGKIPCVDADRRTPTHLHFQLAVDLLEKNEDFPSMVPAAYREIWKALSPDPNLILGIASGRFPSQWSFEETLERRREMLGANLNISYRRPLKIVRGWRQYLYDEAGRAYLDVFNNVPLVGHGHPRVTEAVCRQLGLLNTNTRYLHDTILRYAQRFTALLPSPLRVCYFVNSGSEANELAIRMARTHTRAEDVVVLENAYHGNTGTATDISPYKFNGPGGGGRKPWVHVAPIPDDYRGPYRRGEPDLGKRYALQVAQILDDMKFHGRTLAAYIAESVPSVGGQVFFPEGYLAEVYALIRSAGGLCIADEVQVGFGRLGRHFWGFEAQGVVPDIVVLAKPIGNCFPLAAVITTSEVAASFNNGMEFFSTYGGNPVSCAAGLAVLDVVRDENLQANAAHVGDDLKRRLTQLAIRHPLVGDVRGQGLFLGIDLVTNHETRAPATFQASHIVNRLRERGVLAGTDGPFHNVIKLRPPLVFSREDVDLFATTLDDVLSEDMPSS